MFVDNCLILLGAQIYGHGTFGRANSDGSQTEALASTRIANWHSMLHRASCLIYKGLKLGGGAMVGLSNIVLSFMIAAAKAY